MSLTPEFIIQKYIELRDKRAALKKEWSEKDEELRTASDKLEAWLLKKMDAANTDVIKNKSGTAYTTIDTRISCADWTTFWSWVLENDRVDMLEKRISSRAVKDYIEENGTLPPAVNVMREKTVVVRKS